MYIDEYISNETESFHEILRSCVSIFLIFVILLIIAHIIIIKLKIKQTDDIFFISRKDQCAYQVALFTCTFSVAITMAAMALLPISIISNEIVLKYPRSYYMQWINTSLIQNLWNSVSLSSNITIFILMPFATFFIDSEGFSGMRSNIQNRVMEAICFLCVTIFLLLGVVWILCIPFRDNQSLVASLRDLWQFYLPLVHSGVSFIGVVLLCILSPLGYLQIFLRLITILQRVCSHKVVAPNDCIETEVKRAYFERVENHTERFYRNFTNTNKKSMFNNHAKNLSDNGTYLSKRRYVLHIAGLLILLIITAAIVVLLVFYVIVNIIGIVAGLQALPKSHSQIQLGKYPSSTLGWFGAALQVVLILSLLLSSMYSLYHRYPMNSCLPRLHSTNIHTLMKNSMCLLLLCSASPIQSRLLGVTTFNPLGTFGYLIWLDSGIIVLLYNIALLSLLTLSIFKEALRTSLHKITLVDSLRKVIIYSSPTVVTILCRNVTLKSHIKNV